jgi:hypothetical protein
MEIHHSKHHQAYVTNLNNAIAGTELEGKSPVRPDGEHYCGFGCRAQQRRWAISNSPVLTVSAPTVAESLLVPWAQL